LQKQNENIPCGTLAEQIELLPEGGDPSVPSPSAPQDREQAPTGAIEL
jgi:hypothetical protein